MRILFYGTASYDKESFDKELPAYPDVSIEYTETNLTPLTASLARGYDAVCAFVNANVGALTLEVLAGLGVKLVLMRCAGFDAVNVNMAKDLGITVTRVPAYSPEAIAEHAMALAMCANRRIHKGYIRVRENNFSLGGLVGETLYGKTAGIIGLGRIGQATAKILNAFEMKVLAYDAFESEAGRRVAEYVPLDELFARSDVIFLHCPLFPSTEGIINKDNIAKMKDGVILINNSRGQLVVEQDLADALNSGKVYAAGLDVVSTEPIGADNPLKTAKNTFITPHISWAAQAARQRIMDITVDNIGSYVDGAPINVVNK